MLAPKDGHPLLPSLHSRFVDPVELQEFAVSLADFSFDVAVPKVSGQTKCAVLLLVQGDVIRTFQPDDLIALGFVFVITPGFGVRDKAYAKFLTRQPQGFDVFDLRFDFSEVRHVFCFGRW